MLLACRGRQHSAEVSLAVTLAKMEPRLVVRLRVVGYVAVCLCVCIMYVCRVCEGCACRVYCVGGVKGVCVGGVKGVCVCRVYV